jgi:outer membrane lipoprotein-sorting protein
MKKFSQILLLAIFSLVTNLTFAQTADDVINKYFEVTGGKTKWATLKDVKATGKLKIPSQGLELPMVMLQKAPNKQKMTMTFQGKEIVQPSFDGNEGWNTNFMTMKAEKMEAEDSEIMKQDTDFPDAFWNFKDKGYSITLEGDETVEGVACHKIKLTKKPVKVDGKEEENFSYYFFDKENGVPVMSRSVGKKGQMKGIAIESFMSDYQDVNGVMLPFTMNQKMNGKVMASVVIEKIETNVNVDDKVFAFPQN